MEFSSLMELIIQTKEPQVNGDTMKNVWIQEELFYTPKLSHKLKKKKLQLSFYVIFLEHLISQVPSNVQVFP